MTSGFDSFKLTEMDRKCLNHVPSYIFSHRKWEREQDSRERDGKRDKRVYENEQVWTKIQWKRSGTGQYTRMTHFKLHLQSSFLHLHCIFALHQVTRRGAQVLHQVTRPGASKKQA
jgi:hypothetical protein